MITRTVAIKPPKTNRRSGDDRRHLEGGPPGKHDRRRLVESRKPEVIELDMSSAEWDALADAPPAPKKEESA